MARGLFDTEVNRRGQFDPDVSQRGAFDPELLIDGGVAAVVTGTVTASADEADIVVGGLTVIVTLTGDTFLAAGAAFNAGRQDFINGFDSNTAQANGWDAVVKGTEVVTAIVRTSDTVATWTLSAFPSFDISSIETITGIIPASILTGGVAINATPTFTVAPVAADQVMLTMMGVGA